MRRREHQRIDDPRATWHPGRARSLLGTLVLLTLTACSGAAATTSSMLPTSTAADVSGASGEPQPTPATASARTSPTLVAAASATDASGSPPPTSAAQYQQMPTAVAVTCRRLYPERLRRSHRCAGRRIARNAAPPCAWTRRASNGTGDRGLAFAGRNTGIPGLSRPARSGRGCSGDRHPRCSTTQCPLTVDCPATRGPRAA